MLAGILHYQGIIHPNYALNIFNFCKHYCNKVRIKRFLNRKRELQDRRISLFMEFIPLNMFTILTLSLI